MLRFEITDNGEAGNLVPSPTKTEIAKRKIQNELGVDSKQRIAVKLCDVVKSYQGDDDDVLALDNISLDVHEGETYVLMGPSGAGKSTVLAAIMGLIGIDSGTVILCGKNITNGKPNSQFISYMPQEGMDMAMYPDFTVYELFHFTGRQNGMTKNEVDKMILFFQRVMQFHRWEKQFKKLNSGQQKLVCFGSTILHQPRVVVLDEPFIGVDYSVLANIWKLIRILTNRETTFFVVTHNVEEASKADRVGLMGRGKMIVAGRPDELLDQFQKRDLEDVFLEACLMDEKAERKEAKRLWRHSKRHPGKPVQRPEPVKKAVDLDCGNWDDAKPNHGGSKVTAWTGPIKALLYKNFITVKHFWLLFLAIIWIPTIQNFTIMHTVGTMPKITIGVYNFELSEEMDCCPVLGTCQEYKNAKLFSCLWINYVASENFEFVFFNNKAEAIEALKTGANLGRNVEYFGGRRYKLTGYLGFNSSFTESFIRAMDDDDLTDDENKAFQIDMVYDPTDPVLKEYFVKAMYQSYFQFAEFVKENCDYDSAVGSNLIAFQEAIFEDIDFFGTYIASSALLGILWFFPIVSGAFNAITERQTGSYTRSILAGTGPIQMLIANCARPMVYTVLQTLAWLFVLNTIEGVTIKGSVLLLIFLSMGMGVLGEIIGFIYGLLLKNSLEATIVVLGTYVPVLMMSGIMWPIESVTPTWIQTILWFLPASLPAKAFREISHRGYDIMDERVYLGFVSLAAWITGTFVIFVIIARRDTRLRS